MANSTGKIAEVLFENAVETHEKQQKMVDLCMFKEPDPATMQNANNIIWRIVQQHAPILDGVDLTGQETGIIEETVPCQLGTPKNDFVEQTAPDSRDMGFWTRRGEQSGHRQVSEQNKLIGQAIANQGSLYVRTNTDSGYAAIAEAQALMNERQKPSTERNFVLNDRDNLKFAKDLAGRQTLQGRPENTWKTGQIGQNVAQFDVHVSPTLPNLTGGASPDATVTGNQSFKPEGGTVNASTGVVTNVDYRSATIPVSDSSGYNVGDKVNIGAVQSLGLEDKNSTGQLMTFTIVDKPDGTSITVYPKPIAADDSALSTLEKAYANVNTTISNSDVVARLNITTAKTNLYWEREAVEVTGGTIPAELFREFDGMKVLQETMSNGQKMYMVYDGRIDKLSFRFRIFSWYGITVVDPSNAGVLQTFT